MNDFYPKTQKELQDLLKKLSLADFEITDEDEHEIQGTICEIDDRGPQYRYITIIKPENS
jgi:hypothetical protein